MKEEGEGTEKSVTGLELIQEVLIAVAALPKVQSKHPIAYNSKWLNNTPDLNEKKQRRATRWG